MRLRTIHPKYLDTKGLLAAWREGLLAQKVLLGETQGYRNHPQLLRFKQAKHPLISIGNFLAVLCEEAEERGYSFTREKILHSSPSMERIPVSHRQIHYEFAFLQHKLYTRDPALYEKIQKVDTPEIHPLFIPYEGEIESRERVLSF